jgi:hypothetical protein
MSWWRHKKSQCDSCLRRFRREDLMDVDIGETDRYHVCSSCFGTIRWVLSMIHLRFYLEEKK